MNKFYFPPKSTCFLDPVKAHFVGIALIEAVGVSEGVQRRDGGQDVAQMDGFPQQLQPDHRTGPPQHLHRTLLTATLQTQPIHLREGKQIKR